MSDYNSPNMQFIESSESLKTFCASLSDADYLAIDTEFVRDKTYYPLLCLIQIASNDALACIDPLKVDDLSPLTDILLNPKIRKIFHAARQDLEVLYITLKCIPSPVFDTQLAATLLGLGDQVGYANLVQHILGVQLDKQHTRADWEQRPLTPAQLEYAADDVRYLIQIYVKIQQQLSSLGRDTWLEDDLRTMTNEELYQTDLHTVWQRISGNQKLRRKQLTVLRELAAWREQQAQRLDKPRKWILPDNLLIAIATQTPTTLQKLKSVRGLNEAIVAKQGTAIIEAVNTALALPESQWPEPNKRLQLNKDQEALVDGLLAIIKLKANEHTLNVSAITSRGELEALATNDRTISLLSGWRRELVGNTLLAFLDNKLSLHYQKGRLELTSVT